MLDLIQRKFSDTEASYGWHGKEPLHLLRVSYAS
jgi:hypothetical protein